MCKVIFNLLRSCHCLDCGPLLPQDKRIGDLETARRAISPKHGYQNPNQPPNCRHGPGELGRHTAMGSGSDAFDGEADTSRFYSTYRRSPSPIPSCPRSRSCSKTPLPNLPTNAAKLPTAPASTRVDVAATSDSVADADADNCPPLPRCRDDKVPPGDHLDSGADADAGIGRNIPSLRRHSERCPSLHSDSDGVVSEGLELGNRG
jgi:hypothetical protein